MILPMLLYIDVGTQRVHLETENLRRFEDCWLCLLPARQPVATSKGYIYCKTCLLAHLEKQRTDFLEKKTTWERTQQEREQTAVAEADQNAVLRAAAIEAANTVQTSPQQQLSPYRHKVRTLEDAKKSAYWIRENLPSPGRKKKTEKPPPSLMLKCPASGGRIRLKDLVYLKPQTSAEGDRWICELTHSLIGSQPAFADRSTGQIISETAVKEGLLKGGGKDGSDIAIDNLLALQIGDTGFAAHNEVETTIRYPAFGS